MSVAVRRNAKVKPEPPRVEQTKEGVQVTYPGRTLRKSLIAPPVRPVPVRCPFCTLEGREGRSERVTGGAGVSYYRCLECCDPEHGAPTRFKVPRP